MVYCLTIWWYTWCYIRRGIAAKVNPTRYGTHEAGCQWFETVYFLRPFTGIGMWLQSLPGLGVILRNRALSMFLYNILLSFAHVVGKFTVLFQMHFGLMLFFGFLCSTDFMKFYKHNPRTLRIFRIHQILYFFFSVLAFTLWLIDNFFCTTLLALPVYPHFHSLWHVFCGVSTYTTMVSNAIALNMLKSSKLIGVEVDKDGKALSAPSEDAPVFTNGESGLHLRKTATKNASSGKTEEMEYDLERAQFVCTAPVIDFVTIGAVKLPYHYVHNLDGTKL